MPVPKLYDLHRTIKQLQDGESTPQVELERAIDIAQSSAVGRTNHTGYGGPTRRTRQRLNWTHHCMDQRRFDRRDGFHDRTRNGRSARHEKHHRHQRRCRRLGADNGFVGACRHCDGDSSADGASASANITGGGCDARFNWWIVDRSRDHLDQLEWRGCNRVDGWAHYCGLAR